MESTNYNAEEVISQLKSQDSDFWMKKRELNCLSLFKQASEKVPAYKDFLKKNNVNPDKINTWMDFQSVPPINKNNYLRLYQLKDLCWEGSLANPGVFTSTSGSTGNPVYFIRDNKLDWQYSVTIEYFLRENECNEPTLVIICFGMGIWIGGLMTYKGYEIVAIRNNFPISIITPGINKKEIFNTLKYIAPQFKNVILVGYPPFIKDIVDCSPDQGIDLKKLNLKMHFAAEAISEEMRDYLAEKAGIKNIFKDMLSIYGSADIGAMAQETIAPILIRRIARENKEVFTSIFSPINKTPTLAQFNPDFINFEEVEGEILLTGRSYMPLIRYAIGDNGGVLSFDEMTNKLSNQEIDLMEEFKKVNIDKNIVKLPFVYVYERKDLSTTFFGLWVYPEWIRPALLKEPISESVTGRFTLQTKYDKDKNQFMELNIELKKDKKPTKTLQKILLKEIINSLQSKSSEYREMINNLKKRSYPKLVLWPYEDPTYFAPGIKQKWVIQT